MGSCVGKHHLGCPASEPVLRLSTKLSAKVRTVLVKVVLERLRPAVARRYLRHLSESLSPSLAARQGPLGSILGTLESSSGRSTAPRRTAGPTRAPPQRLRHPVLRRRLPRAARLHRSRRRHEPPRRLLGQRDDGELLQDAQNELATAFASRQQARRELFDYIEGFYNTRRLHSSLGYRSPALSAVVAVAVEVAAPGCR